MECEAAPVPSRDENGFISGVHRLDRYLSPVRIRNPEKLVFSTYVGQVPDKFDVISDLICCRGSPLCVIHLDRFKDVSFFASRDFSFLFQFVADFAVDTVNGFPSGGDNQQIRILEPGWMFLGLGCCNVSSISFSLSCLTPDTVLDA